MAYEHWPHGSFDMLRLYRFFSGGRRERPGCRRSATEQRDELARRSGRDASCLAPPHRTARKIVNLSDNLAVGVDYGLTVIGSSNGAQQFAEFIMSSEGQVILMKHGFTPGK